MPNKVEWTIEWPTEEGYYWFYGWRPPQDTKDESPVLYFIKTELYEWGMFYLIVGSGETPLRTTWACPIGLWTKAQLPELPEIERPEIEE